MLQTMWSQRVGHDQVTEHHHWPHPRALTAVFSIVCPLYCPQGNNQWAPTDLEVCAKLIPCPGTWNEKTPRELQNSSSYS